VNGNAIAIVAAVAATETQMVAHIVETYVETLKK
jgi:hypothetical protein